MSADSVRVEPAAEGDLAAIAEMEQDEEARRFITPATLDEHRVQMAMPQIAYLRILVNGAVSGFFILVLEDDGDSVEFRRIVVSQRERGIGQRAISEMEQFCVQRLGRGRVWLDVFADNARGQHVYEKLGYRQFRTGEARGRELLFYEKRIG